jgi:hypothetical protein
VLVSCRRRGQGIPGHNAVVNAAVVSWMQRRRVFSIGHDGVVCHGEHEGAGAHACGQARSCESSDLERSLKNGPAFNITLII